MTIKNSLMVLGALFIGTVAFAQTPTHPKSTSTNSLKEEQLILEAQESQSSNTKILGVNTFLWYASRDVLKFLPMQVINPLTGILISNWYTIANTSNERIKIQVTITSKTLRTDAVVVQVFQQKNIKGRWVDTSVNPATKTYIQDAILRQARKLRIASGKSSLD